MVVVVEGPMFRSKGERENEARKCRLVQRKAAAGHIWCLPQISSSDVFQF